MAVAASFVVLFMCLFAYVGPFLSPYAPDQVNLRERFSKPSIVMSGTGQQATYGLEAIQTASEEKPLKFGHPLGTDDLGRDTMTRAMYGGRVSLAIGFLVSMISVSMGVTLGSI